ncbi:MAG: undecaprenyl/decaprenyl-phosphate alpha-N-acetylglucosaminyl 1-phosphate transferase [Synergistaceae bacterium]|jgi:UDP-GlcNAc:undecaprenyl-phosphate GlcNAc-1-phosphate transferase|nr:undecaprenyl/decaprenyl-phosphate alpha-N-acetylglucosaminyl 1-phosphate transferase [Synergistaceae bacterium]
MNVQLALTGLFGFFWGGFVTPIAIRLARDYQIMDHPDPRKIHKNLTPRGAGLALWAGYLLWTLYAVSDFEALRYSATAATLVFFCGYMDDMRSLSPFLRLAAHLYAAYLVVAPLPMPFFSRTLCFFWIAGATSAYNLIDGVNGLCISIFISSAATLCLVGDVSFGVAGASIALGVLCWNFPMAQTFLGDGGSTLLGFLFATHFVSVAAPVLAKVGLHELILLLLAFGGVPVLDTLAAFSRRIINGKSPFYPDRGHLHHRLMELTRSPFWAVACLILLHALFLAGGAIVYARLEVLVKTGSRL